MTANAGGAPLLGMSSPAIGTILSRGEMPQGHKHTQQHDKRRPLCPHLLLPLQWHRQQRAKSSPLQQDPYKHHMQGILFGAEQRAGRKGAPSAGGSRVNKAQASPGPIFESRWDSPRFSRSQTGGPEFDPSGSGFLS